MVKIVSGTLALNDVHFRNGNTDVTAKPRCGRPLSAATAENKSGVDGLIRNDRRRIFLFGPLKDYLRGQTFHNDDKIKAAVRTWVRQCEPHFFANTVEKPMGQVRGVQWRFCREIIDSQF